MDSLLGAAVMALPAELKANIARFMSTKDLTPLVTGPRPIPEFIRYEFRRRWHENHLVLAEFEQLAMGALWWEIETYREMHRIIWEQFLTTYQWPSWILPPEDPKFRLTPQQAVLIGRPTLSREQCYRRLFEIADYVRYLDLPSFPHTYWIRDIVQAMVMPVIRRGVTDFEAWGSRSVTEAAQSRIGFLRDWLLVYAQPDLGPLGDFRVVAEMTSLLAGTTVGPYPSASADLGNPFGWHAHSFRMVRELFSHADRDIDTLVRSTLTFVSTTRPVRRRYQEPCNFPGCQH